MECRIIYFFLQGCTLLQVARLASTATPSAGSWMRPGKVLVSALSTTCSSVTWLPSSTSWSSQWLVSHSSFPSQVRSCQRLRQKQRISYPMGYQVKLIILPGWLCWVKSSSRGSAFILVVLAAVQATKLESRYARVLNKFDSAHPPSWIFFFDPQ